MRAAELLLAATTIVASLSAQALQTIDARDGVAVEAMISTREPTRIRIDGAPITDVFGNIYASQCANLNPLPPPGVSPPAQTTAGVNPVGEIVLECDRDKGEIYVRPVGDATKPINLFVSSASATYTLLLRRADTPADTIVIRDTTPRGRPAMGASVPAGPAPNHLRAMKLMLVAMATDRPPSDIHADAMQRPLRLWTEARFAQVGRFEGRGLIGEKYLLQNISAAPMVIAEPEFDRAGDAADGDIAGIAIEHHNLRPGDSTHIYVIRRKASP